MATILLTGATGYVGHKLLPELLKTRHSVRCLVRRPVDLGAAETVIGDVLKPETLVDAMAGIDIAYYLIHSMGNHGDWYAQDSRAARAFGDAARIAGVRRIIYLGGLGSDEDALSDHLRSRHEVGKWLAAGGVEVVEFRASIIVGARSLSFEMIRALVERLPVMVTPRWINSKTQPLADTDLIQYLLGALELPPDNSVIMEIGGPDEVSYGELMREYARQRGLRRLMLPVPVLTPWLSGLWLGLITPLQARVGRHLAMSLCNPTVVERPIAPTIFDVEPIGYSQAIANAIREDEGPPQTESFIYRTRLEVPAEVVYAWHDRPEAFSDLNPPWEDVHVVSHEGLKEGARAVMEMKIGPFTRHWIAEHTDIQPGREFTDYQVQGPFVYWRHRHKMIPDGDHACWLEDDIRFALPFGGLGQTLAGGYVRRKLNKMFAYRHQLTRESVRV